jgi:hypothetical protein
MVGKISWMWVFTSVGRFLELFKNRRFLFWTKPDRIKEPEPIRNLESKNCQSRLFQISERIDGFHEITSQRAGGSLVSSFLTLNFFLKTKVIYHYRLFESFENEQASKWIYAQVITGGYKITKISLES